MSVTILDRGLDRTKGDVCAPTEMGLCVCVRVCARARYTEGGGEGRQPHERIKFTEVTM